MARQIDYPRAGLKNCLQLAHAVEELGGKCSIELAADKLNKKLSGAFTALVGSTVRFGLIDNKKGQLEITSLFSDYKLAYSKDEGTAVLVKAFLSPPLFKRIHTRFQEKLLPISHFEKLLIREFGVPKLISSRVSKYFLEGAKQCGLLGANNVLLSSNSSSADNENTGDILESPSETNSNDRAEGDDFNVSHHQSSIYSVRISGPGMNSVIAINDEEDLMIVQAMLRKVKKKLGGDTEFDGDSIKKPL